MDTVFIHFIKPIQNHEFVLIYYESNYSDFFNIVYVKLVEQNNFFNENFVWEQFKLIVTTTVSISSCLAHVSIITINVSLTCYNECFVICLNTTLKPNLKLH